MAKPRATPIIKGETKHQWGIANKGKTSDHAGAQAAPGAIDDRLGDDGRSSTSAGAGRLGAGAGASAAGVASTGVGALSTIIGVGVDRLDFEQLSGVRE
ncbi:unnamed protein product [Ilex paraguariensis]|uniref:Uncharacterized protein n=1 Tax=Ilex paraguariensis TaxID=185542 RepID=A0ABC8RIU1_9AQUA